MTGLIRRSCEQIERFAEEVLSQIDRDVLYNPQPMPVGKVMQFMTETHGVGIGWDIDLVDPGKYEVASKRICIAANVWETSRWRFVLAHEIGHALLHKDVRFEGDEYYEQANEQKEYDVFSGKRKIKTERDILGWQANRFASAITIPRLRFRDKLIEIQRMLGIPRAGQIYRDSNRYSLADYHRTMAYLCFTYGVSRMSILCRLRTLNLINPETRWGRGLLGWLDAEAIINLEQKRISKWAKA